MHLRRAFRGRLCGKEGGVGWSSVMSLSLSSNIGLRTVMRNWTEWGGARSLEIREAIYTP